MKVWNFKHSKIVKFWWQISCLILYLQNKLIQIIFSVEDHSLSQYIKIDPRSQESQRKHIINKTQEVRGDEEFEADSDYGQFAK